MSRLSVQIIHPKNADVNSVLAEIERKYASKRVTPENIAEMEKEAARLIRRLITTQVTYIKG